MTLQNLITTLQSIDNSDSITPASDVREALKSFLRETDPKRIFLKQAAEAYDAAVKGSRGADNEREYCDKTNELIYILDAIKNGRI